MPYQLTQQRNLNFVNVKDYGAQGDGKTDDTVSIQASIAAVSVTDTSMLFNGSTGYISCSGSGLPTGANAWSMETWVQVPASLPGGFPTFIGFGTATGDESTFLLYHGGRFSVGNWGGFNLYGGTASASGVYHVVGTYDGTTVRLYVNGVQVASTTHTYALVNGFCQLGNDPSGDWWSGSLSQVALYNTTLSATQVATHYNHGLVSCALYIQTVLADSPLRYYRLNETSGTIAHDSGSQAQNGTINGGVTLGQTGLLPSTGGTVFFPGGSYLLSSPLTITASNITLMANEQATLLPTSGADPAYLLEIGTTANQNNCAVLGLNFQGKGTTTSTGGGIRAACSNLLIRDVTASQCGGRGLSLTAISGTIGAIVLEHVTLTKNGMNTTTPADNLVVDSSVTNVDYVTVISSQAGAAGFNLTGGFHSLYDCQANNNTGDGFLLTLVNQGFLVGGGAQNNGGNGINAQTASIPQAALGIANMFFYGNTAASDIFINSAASPLVVGCSAASICNTVANIRFYRAQFGLLADCIVGNGTAPAVTIEQGISKFIVIHDCSLFSAGTTALSLSGTHNTIHDNGVTGNIVEVAGADYSLFHDNNGTGTLTLIGTHSVARNTLTYNPVGPLTAPAIAASGTAVQNTFPVTVEVHVYGGTVSAIGIGNTSSTTATGLTSGSFRLDPAQYISITYTVQPSWSWFGY
jgi:hypothetical protein